MTAEEHPNNDRHLEGLRFVFWMEGVDACRRGLPVTDNPYRPEVKQHVLWEEGWRSASGPIQPTR